MRVADVVAAWAVSQLFGVIGDDPRTVLAVYAHVLGEDQRRMHAERLTQAERTKFAGGPLGDPRELGGPDIR